MSGLRASGGFCAPVPDAFVDWWNDPGIWGNRISYLRGWRKFFSWDKGWGFPLRGGRYRLRDSMPTFKAVRGGIRFGTVDE